MPKIRVEVDVPDGDMCGKCNYLYQTFDAEWICSVFHRFAHQDDEKLPQCIAAEVKPAPEE